MKILICTDGEQYSYEAIKVGAKMARKIDAEITLLYVCHRHKPPVGYDLEEEAEKQVAEIVKEFNIDLPGIKILKEGKAVFQKEYGYDDVQKGDMECKYVFKEIREGLLEEMYVCKETNNPIRLRLRYGSPAKEIEKETKEGKYDLTILGAHKSGILDWIELGNVPQKVVHNATSSVMVIKEDINENDKFLVCIKNDRVPENLLFMVKNLSTSFSASIDLLTILKEPKDDYKLPPSVEELIFKLKEDKIFVNTLIRDGNPVRQILALEGEYKLLILVASKKLRQYFYIGSTAIKVLDKSSSNVLVIR